MTKILLLTLSTLLLTGCLENINSFFTKQRDLKQTGQNIIYTNNDDAYYQSGIKENFNKINNTIIDNITNLKWQNNKETITLKLSQNKAISYCSNLNLDNDNNWRLPSIQELLTLINYGKANSSISNIFIDNNMDNNTDNNTSNNISNNNKANNKNKAKNNNNLSYWSSTIYKKDSSLAWGIDFKYGDDFHQNIKHKFNIRCVSGDKLIKSKFKRNNKSKIVKDITLNLQWQDNNNSKTTEKTFQEAISHCENLSLGGYNNWRLPNIKELLSITDKDNESSINPIFKNTSLIWLYWSSTTDVSSNDFARAIWFRNGGDWIYPKSSLNFTRCVRNVK